MKYRLHLTKTHTGTREDNGTNYPLIDQEGDNFVEWQLLDNCVADKFIQSYNMINGVHPKDTQTSSSKLIVRIITHKVQKKIPLEEYPKQIIH